MIRRSTAVRRGLWRTGRGSAGISIVRVVIVVVRIEVAFEQDRAPFLQQEDLFLHLFAGLKGHDVLLCDFHTFAGARIARLAGKLK